MSLLPIGNLEGKNFAEYNIIREIARGGMGVVYLAWQEDLRRQVALKILLIQEEEDRERFIREAEIHSQLSHFHIIPIYQVGEEQGYPFFTMKYTGGKTFSDLLTKEKRNFAEEIKVLLQVSSALAHAHRKKIIHRDIKPSNILIDDKGHSFLADFGIAKKLDLSSSLTHSDAMIGTPVYSSPELVMNEKDKISPASDVYSLGVILYQILTGHLPYEVHSVSQLLVKICREDPTAPRKHNPEIDPQMEQICLRALNKDHRERYRSAALFERDLRKALAGQKLRLQTNKYKKYLLPWAICIITAFVLAILANSRSLSENNWDPQVAAKEWVGVTSILEMDTLIRKYPRYGEGYFQRALLLRKQNRKIESLRDISKAVELSPNTLYTLRKGTWLYQDGYLPEAQESLTSLDENKISQNEQDQVREILGYIYFAREQYQKAIQEYRGITSLLEPHFLLMGKSYFYLGNSTLAYSFLEKAYQSEVVEIRNESSFYLGKIAHAKKENSTAQKLLRESLSTPYSKRNEAFLLLAKISLTEKDLQMAEKYLFAITDSDRNTQQWFELAARCFFAQRKYEQAHIYVDHLMRFEPWVGRHIYLKGQIYQEQEEYYKAEKYFLKCLQIEPRNLEPLIQVMQNQVAQGRISDLQKIQLFIDNINSIDSLVIEPNLFATEIKEYCQTILPSQVASSKLFSASNVQTFLDGLIHSDSPAVWEIATSGLKSYAHREELLSLITKALKQKLDSKAKNRLWRLHKIATEIYQHEEVKPLQKVLCRYYFLNDQEAFLLLYPKKEETIRQLLFLLSTDDPISQLLAIRALVDLKIPETEEVWSAILKKPELKIFAKTFRYRQIPTMEEILALPPFWRYSLVSDLPMAEYLQDLFHTEKDPRVRLALAKKMRIHYDFVDELLLDQIKNASGDIYRYALYEYFHLPRLRKLLCPKISQLSLDVGSYLRNFRSSEVRKLFWKKGIMVDISSTVHAIRQPANWFLFDPVAKQRYYLFRRRDHFEVRQESIAFLEKKEKIYRNIKLLSSALTSSDLTTKQIAISHLAEFAEKDLDRQIEQEIKNSDSLTRFYAVSALSSRRYFSPQEHHRKIAAIAMDQKENPFIRISIFTNGVYYFNKTPHLIVKMWQATQKDPNPSFRIISLAAMGGAKKGFGVSLILSFLESEDFAARLGSLAAVVRASHLTEVSPIALESMLKATKKLSIQDPNPIVQHVAAGGGVILCILHRPEMLNEFLAILDKSDSFTKQGAAIGFVRCPQIILGYHAVPSSENSRWDATDLYLNFTEQIVVQLKNMPSNPERVTRRWRHRLDMKLFIDCYNHAIRLAPEKEKFWLERGLLLYASREYGKSIRDIQEAIQRDPTNPIFYFWLAKAQYKSGQFSQARVSAQKAAKSFPKKESLCELQEKIARRMNLLQEASYYKQKYLILKNKI